VVTVDTRTSSLGRGLAVVAAAAALVSVLPTRLGSAAPDKAGTAKASGSTPAAAASETPGPAGSAATSTSPEATPSASAGPTISAGFAIPWSGDGGDTRAGLDPFPSNGSYVSYGASFFSESPIAFGRLCRADSKEPCVLGNGGGLSLSGSFRAPTWSLGAVYEVTFHDSNGIYQRGVLQQLRGELRARPRWAAVGDSVAGVSGLGIGIATYGDDWAISTFGPSAHALVGADIDLGVKLSVLVAFAYRLIYFRSFQDASSQDRPASLVSVLGFQLGLELHDPL
jgi:hypothetical protein